MDTAAARRLGAKRGMSEVPNLDNCRVVVTQRLPVSVETRMRELFEVEFNQSERTLGKEGLCEAVRRASVLVPTVTDNIDAEVLSHATSDLKLIANYGTGVDHIDVDEAERLDIVVTNTPNVLTEDTADLAMALILAAMRRMVEGAIMLHNQPDSWSGWAPNWMLGARLAGKRLGIIGMGRIGRALAKRAAAFGMQIHYHNRNRVSRSVEQQLHAAYWEDVDSMLRHVDVVSVNCPATRETRNLLNRENLALLRPHAVVVNTARGDIVDEEALIDALESEAIQAVGLDVFANEPVVPARLAKHPRAVCVPHMGSSTRESRRAMGERVIINIQAFLDDHPVPDRVIV